MVTKYFISTRILGIFTLFDMSRLPVNLEKIWSFRGTRQRRIQYIISKIYSLTILNKKFKNLSKFYSLKTSIHWENIKQSIKDILFKIIKKLLLLWNIILKHFLKSLSSICFILIWLTFCGWRSKSNAICSEVHWFIWGICNNTLIWFIGN